MSNRALVGAPGPEARDPEDGIWPDSTDWEQLTTAGAPGAIAAAWLKRQCGMIAGLEQGVVVFSADGAAPFPPVAVWPESRAIGSALAEVAEMALERRRGAVRGGMGEDGVQRSTLAFPLIVNERIYGVAAVEGIRRGDAELPLILRQLQWGCAWLELLARPARPLARERLAAVLDLAASVLRSTRFLDAARAAAGTLASELECERVAIGFRHGLHTRVRALSNDMPRDRHGVSLQGLMAAMDEALDQRASVVYPESPERPSLIVRAHAELLERAGAGALCTLPLAVGERLVGAITLERRLDQPPFRADEIALCERAAAVIGPLLEAKRREARWIGLKLFDAVRGGCASVLGTRRLGLKLAALALAGCGALLALTSGEYRVHAPATLEGLIQRVVTAPIDGYIATSTARVGDRVGAGETLLTLDDKDLRLEQRRLDGERTMLERGYSQSLATGGRSDVRILDARLAQNEARRHLVEEQLAHTRVTAPFSGVLVSGDLTQSLGAPVSRGQVLFQVAPLDAYRIRLLVSEDDLPDVRVGQAGRLVVRGLSIQAVPIRVSGITPVSRFEQGRNVFEVQALLDETPAGLRPGMAGVAKIAIAPRRRLWIWTHRPARWTGRWLWSWLG